MKLHQLFEGEDDLEFIDFEVYSHDALLRDGRRVRLGEVNVFDGHHPGADFWIVSFDSETFEIHSIDEPNGAVVHRSIDPGTWNMVTKGFEKYVKEWKNRGRDFVNDLKDDS